MGRVADLCCNGEGGGPWRRWRAAMMGRAEEEEWWRSLYSPSTTVQSQRTKHYCPITTDQALQTKHYCLCTALQDGKNTDLEQSGGH